MSSATKPARHPTTAPAMSAAKSGQLQILPCALLSPYSLPMPHAVAPKNPAMQDGKGSAQVLATIVAMIAATIKQTKKCCNLSFAIFIVKSIGYTMQR